VTERKKGNKHLLEAGKLYIYIYIYIYICKGGKGEKSGGKKDGQVGIY
jgi:hypothetical protein